jgi:hypothetical protein
LRARRALSREVPVLDETVQQATALMINVQGGWTFKRTESPVKSLGWAL